MASRAQHVLWVASERWRVRGVVNEKLHHYATLPLLEKADANCSTIGFSTQAIPKFNKSRENMNIEDNLN